MTTATTDFLTRPAFPAPNRRVLSAALAVLLGMTGCREAEIASTTGGDKGAGNRPQAQVKETAGAVTFTKDVAPLVFAHCAPCHRAGQVAPFSLTSYRDVASRAEQVADVTGSRYMPPWKPVPGHGNFADSRRLSDQQVALLRAWFDAGTPEGDAKDLPHLPEFPPGWLLGEPDLVVRMSEPYTLPAGTGDQFRSFVIPIPIDATRYVRGLECRPTNPRVVHHADILFDPTGQSRELDALDPVPGFEGMRPVETASVGHLTGWAPGGTPILYPSDMTWNLDPASDLILTLHMLPTGKPEPVDFLLGFYFSDTPPARPSYVLRLASTTIDVPPGVADYEVEDSYVLPVDVEAVGVRPHAHYLGKLVEAHATLPDERVVPLLLIDDWDFNWQDDYRFAEPIPLPRGTRVSMRWVYDNSADNVRNPHSPPQRVTWGANSSDEMGLALIQVRVNNPDDYHALALDLQAKGLRDKIRGYEQMIRHHPDDAGAHSSLEYYYSIYRDKQEIASRLETDCRQSPGDPFAHYCLGTIRRLTGDVQGALEMYQRAVEIQPDYHIARFEFARSLFASGRTGEAIVELTRVADALPALYRVHAALGTALQQDGKTEAAAESFARALAIFPGEVTSQLELGNIELQRGNLSAADRLFRGVLATEPASVVALVNLGVLLQQQGQLDQANQLLNQAVQADPENWQAQANLASCARQRQEFDVAIEHYQEAIRINPRAWDVRMSLGGLWMTLGETDQGAAQFVAVADGEPKLVKAHLQAAQALKLAGRIDDALKYYRSAHQLGENSLAGSVGLAWILATHPDPQLRSPAEAIQLTEPFVAGKNPHPMALDTLAAAWAASGDFDRATELATRAEQVASAAQLTTLAERIAARVALYRQGKPFVEQAQQPLAPLSN